MPGAVPVRSFPPSRSQRGTEGLPGTDRPTRRRRRVYGLAVPPEIRRFLPLIALGLFAVLILPSILHKSSSGTPASTVATGTTSALSLIDTGEQTYKAGHGRYTDKVADLLTPKLADDLGLGILVDIGISTDGQTYYGRVTSTALSLVRARQGDKQIADSCVVVKSGKGVSCPAPPAAPGTTTTTTK